MRYNRVGRRCQGSGNKGFRLNPRRFSVQGLRARFFYLFRLLSRWRTSYGRALRLIKKLGINIGNSSIKRDNSSGRVSSSSSRTLVTPKELQLPLPNSTTTRLRPSLGRSNSFYSEAIADCLEFIKRSSLSVDQRQPLPACQR